MRSVLFLALCTATSSAFALSCGDTITADTRLTSDLDCPMSPAALIVERSGVTLDLNGHTIRGGDNTVAIELESVNRVTVRGPGRIVGAATGVEATRTKALLVEGVEFANVGDGVRLHNSSRSEVANNRFDGVDGHAVAVLALPYALTRGGQHSIHDNVVVNSEYGVLLDGVDSGSSLVADNRFERIGTYAIQSGFEWDRNRIENNDFSDIGVAEVAY